MGPQLSDRITPNSIVVNCGRTVAYPKENARVYAMCNPKIAETLDAAAGCV